jgi:GTP-binding protein HflX
MKSNVLISIDNMKDKQIAILVGLQLPGMSAEECREHLDELGYLADTAGLKVANSIIQDRPKIHPSVFVGKGKADELAQIVQQTGAKIVIFDDDLTPAQIRNLENLFGVKVIDRSALILDIFAKHARTKEAKTQVELAQLQYLLPRLTRQWTHLSRQVGGIGIRGPGETQLETDRRLIRKRIEKLRSDLKKISTQQSIRRQNRKDHFKVALVGYTNVGKSSIMNLLSGSEILVENQLFATLDSIVRKVKLNRDHDILLSDTVGFIRKLPPHLVASFMSTLEEVTEADLLLHVVDIQHPQFREQMYVVMKVLQQLMAHQKPILVVFNKIDMLSELAAIKSLKKEYSNSIFFSALRKIGVEALTRKIIQNIESHYVTALLRISIKDQRFLHMIHSNCHVLEKNYDGDFIDLKIKCHRHMFDQLNENHRHSDFTSEIKKTTEEMVK